MNKKIDHILDLINTLPGFSRKQSERFLNEVLKNNLSNRNTLKELSEYIGQIDICKKCLIVKEEKNECQNCEIQLNKNNIYLVSSYFDYLSVTKKGLGKDSIFVVMNIKNKEDSILRLKKIISLQTRVSEVISLLAPSAETDIFNNEINKSLFDYKNIFFSKIATGIPYGSSIEYMDEKTIEIAIKRREKNE